jgi:hypothetical protein
MARGDAETEMSLVTVTTEAPLSAVFAALMACTDTVTGDGRIAGAV